MNVLPPGGTVTTTCPPRNDAGTTRGSHGSFVRIAPYRYRLVGGEPLSFPKDADRTACTQLLNDRLGEAIRKYPEQYLWAHRRWR